jgi:hypothetical protein
MNNAKWLIVIKLIAELGIRRKKLIKLSYCHATPATANTDQDRAKNNGEAEIGRMRRSVYLLERPIKFIPFYTIFSPFFTIFIPLRQ